MIHGESIQELSMLADIVCPDGETLSAVKSRFLLSLRFTQTQRLRMSELSDKAQEGTLSTEEMREAECFHRVGCVLGLMQSKARQSIAHVYEQ